MRSILASACALLLLSGCGRGPTESPAAAINPRPSGTAQQSGKETPTTKNAQSNPDKQTQVAAVKGEASSAAAGPTFSANNPQQTLAWLIHNASRLRSTPSGDQAARDREWEEFTRTLKSATGQKIHWELPVKMVRMKDKRPKGVVTERVKSAGEPACTGLRLKPEQQPTGFTTFILKLPAAKSTAPLRAGSRVLVSGTVTRIETDLRKSRPDAATFGFNIRLSDYTVTPVD